MLVLVCIAAAQFLSRIIPFLFNVWFVRQLGSDDSALSVWISPSLLCFVVFCNAMC
jgi:hypothetical protein